MSFKYERSRSACHTRQTGTVRSLRLRAPRKSERADALEQALVAHDGLDSVSFLFVSRLVRPTCCHCGSRFRLPFFLREVCALVVLLARDVLIYFSNQCLRLGGTRVLLSPADAQPLAQNRSLRRCSPIQLILFTLPLLSIHLHIVFLPSILSVPET